MRKLPAVTVRAENGLFQRLSGVHGPENSRAGDDGRTVAAGALKRANQPNGGEEVAGISRGAEIDDVCVSGHTILKAYLVPRVVIGCRDAGAARVDHRQNIVRLWVAGSIVKAVP